MKMHFLFVAILSLSTIAVAFPLIECDIKLNSQNDFSYLENGKAYTDLSTGQLSVVSVDSKKYLIDELSVSTRNAPIKTCSLSSAVDTDDNQKLKSFKFYYVDCVLPNQRSITVTNSYNWKTNRGVYQEALNVDGNYGITFFFLENCLAINP